MPMTPFTDDERELIRRLHAEGMSRNAITRQTGIHAKRVSAIAQELGLTFARAGQVAEATRVKQADAAARRAALQLRALDNAHRLLEQMFAPVTAYNFGGKDNSYNEHRLPEPSHRDKRDLAVAIQALTNSASRLAELDKGAGVDGAKSMLGALAAGLGQVYEQLQAADQAPDADQP